MRDNANANNEKLINIFNEMKNKLLKLRPAFQRNLVWSKKHRENFIETILMGYPFPEVYFCEGDVDIELQRSTRLVVDGQQRLSTIYSYMTGDLKCSRIKTFSELTDAEKKKFYTYKIVVRDLGDINDTEIREVFKRINSVGYALNAMEIRNALYEGEFISIAQRLAESKEMEELDIFSETQHARMKNAEFILLVMTTIEVGGYFGRDDEVETLIKALDDQYPNKTKIVKDITEALKLIVRAKLPADSIWFRLSSFFTLVVELIKYNRSGEKQLTSVCLKKKLTNLERTIQANKSGNVDKNQYSRYYHFTFQGTASKTGRIARGKVLERHLRIS